MKTKRHIYLQMKSVEEAGEIFLGRFLPGRCLQAETIRSKDAAGRVTDGPVFARFSSPGFHVAAMDGIAVAAEITFGSNVDRPRHLNVGKEAFFVNTGEIMPPGTDAVVMIEFVTTVDDETVQIESPVHPWQNVRKVGEDIVATELIIPENHLIRPYDIGALLSSGVFEVTVKKRPRVIIIPTGSELIDPDELAGNDPPPGRVIESNSAVLGALVEQWGGEYLPHAIVPDIYEDILAAAQEAASSDADLVIVTAGSSAGSEDYTAGVIAELGEVLVHGVTMMPGKPTVLGSVEEKPVIGIPGYPVSAIMAFERFAQPLILGMLGIRSHGRPRVKATASRKMASKLGIEELIRVKLGRVRDTIVASSLPRGAGCVTTITEADGIITVPGHVEGVRAGEEVEVELLKDLEEIENTVVVIGSHDNSIDLLANEMRARDFRFSLSSTNVGSLGGLIALKNGYCHVAGSHLLDTETGAYNISYVKRYLPEMRVRLINLVYREQGLIVARGNPKGISGIKDLARDDVVFINRQAGSGTRVLLDHLLGKLAIRPDTIKGYERDEFTHMSVAVSVLSAAADAGLGIYAAARALRLDFVPIATEQYDLVIPEEFLEDKRVSLMLEVVRSGGFKEAVRALGGYDTSKTGAVVARL